MAQAQPFTVALVSDVFFGDDAGARLVECLRHARQRGAVLAVLPELPLDAWIPGRREGRDQDAEGPDGPRQRALGTAAREAGIAVLGGAIVRDPTSGQRHNQALFYDDTGAERGRYTKLHLPCEAGFWEPDHYQPGAGDLPLLGLHGVPFGVQICSDINRPHGAHILAARGARFICHPRATEATTFERWRLVMQATAVTASTWVLSVNRPRPEHGVPLGGPSLAVDPTGAIVAQSEETFTFVTVDPARNDEAAGRYPGYLAVRSDLYATAWAETLPRPRASTAE